MNCPACNTPLKTQYILAHARWLAYCPFGPCPSRKANDGATGATEDEALLHISGIVYEEMCEREEEQAS